MVQLRCRAPRSGVRFALVRKDAREHRVHGLLSPEGTEALFELRDVSGAHSGNYSCVYTDLAPPFSGSAPSASVELRVDGEPRTQRSGALPAHAPNLVLPVVGGGRRAPWARRARSLGQWEVGRRGARAARHLAHFPPKRGRGLRAALWWRWRRVDPDSTVQSPDGFAPAAVFVSRCDTLVDCPSAYDPHPARAGITSPQAHAVCVSLGLPRPGLPGGAGQDELWAQVPPPDG